MTKTSRAIRNAVAGSLLLATVTLTVTSIPFSFSEAQGGGGSGPAAGGGGAPGGPVSSGGGTGPGGAAGGPAAAPVGSMASPMGQMINSGVFHNQGASAQSVDTLLGQQNSLGAGAPGASAGPRKPSLLELCAQGLQAAANMLNSSALENGSARDTGDGIEIAARRALEEPELDNDHETVSSRSRAASGRGSGTVVVNFDCDQDGRSDSPITLGQGSDTQCSREEMHKGMAEHMNRAFLGCVQESAQTAGMVGAEGGTAEPIQGVHLNHMGCKVVRAVNNGTNSKTPSLHSYGRAIDIGAIILKPSGKKISMHIRDATPQNRAFYNALRTCWDRNLPPGCDRGRESFGSIGYPGSTGPSNGLHNDHLHLTYPPCAGN